MTEKELLYFKTVADEKSISAAAKKLFIAQPSLTQCIKRIESAYEMPLFTRTSKGLILTYAGERYYLLASEILKMCETFNMEISDINNLKTGQVKLGVTRYLGSWLLPQILPLYKASYPNIQLEICENTSSELEARLLSGQLDFAMMHTPSPERANPSLNYDFFGVDPFLIVLPADSPLASLAEPLEDSELPYPELDLKYLKEENFVMVAKGQRSREICDSLLQSAGITEPKISASFSNLNTVHRCVAAGLGVTILPEHYLEISAVHPTPRYFSLSKEYHANWNLCITTMKDSYMTLASRYFIELIKDCIEENSSPLREMMLIDTPS